MRLNKFIAQSGITSRRKADDLINEGRIFINGEKTTTLGTKIDPSKDVVTLDGKQIKQQEELIYLVLNKPKDYITTLKDEKGRKTVIDLLPKELRKKGLKPVGRLDKETEGLLLLTNDLELINKLTHPRYEKEKEYEAKITGILTKTEKEKLENGINLDDKKTSPCTIKIIKTENSSTDLKITLKEGRKRQIRKMFQLLGHHVLYLQRIRIGNLSLGHPPIGTLKTGETILIDPTCLQAY